MQKDLRREIYALYQSIINNCFHCLFLQIIKHLPKSSEIICATVDRDEVFKERAYLFIKNHSDKWFGTNLSAGREFCCKDYTPYKCPLQR